MRPEFTIERHGRKFVLVAGLLDAGHSAGVQSIEQEVLQFPAEENGHTTICRATVTDKDGRRFQGIGDANAGNVGKAIQPHSIRMAATRSVARALRDFLNIGAVSLEEMGGDDAPDAQQAASSGQRTGRGSTDSQEASSTPERTRGGASRKAAGKLWHLAKDGYGLERLERLVGKEIQDMDAGSVSEWIEKLEGEA